MTLLNVVSSSLSLSVDGDILGNPMCSKYIPQETDFKPIYMLESYIILRYFKPESEYNESIFLV